MASLADRIVESFNENEDLEPLLRESTNLMRTIGEIAERKEQKLLIHLCEKYNYAHVLRPESLLINFCVELQLDEVCAHHFQNLQAHPLDVIERYAPFLYCEKMPKTMLVIFTKFDINRCCELTGRSIRDEMIKHGDSFIKSLL